MEKIIVNAWKLELVPWTNSFSDKIKSRLENNGIWRIKHLFDW